MLYRDHGAGWIDERTPTDLFPRSRANLAAEANANRFTAAGGTGVVLRFGWFYGPGATHSEQLLALAQHHVGVVLGPPEGLCLLDPRGGRGQGHGRGPGCAGGDLQHRRRRAADQAGLRGRDGCGGRQGRLAARSGPGRVAVW
jgi:hypothetical protein